MKKALLLIALFCVLITYATPVKKAIIPTTQPAIGVMMTGVMNGSTTVIFSIKIKNIGNETLTNIYATNYYGSGIFFNFTTIPSLAPGEEVINLTAYKSVYCFDLSQIQIHATTIAGTEITDLSSDQNSSSDSYYNDSITFSGYNNPKIIQQTSNYVDYNQNGIVDVGDSIEYFYYAWAQEPAYFMLHDSNAIIANPYIDSTNNNIATGYHYLTAAEIDLGYVYNSSYADTYDCSNSCYIYQYNPCNNCPNPSGANIVTSLFNVQPNYISGQLKFNAYNDNCATGLALPYRGVSTTSGANTYTSFTNSIGNYITIIPTTGVYITAPHSASGFTSNPTNLSTTSLGTGVNYSATDFCISSANNYADLRVQLFNLNQAIPGNVCKYRLCFINDGTTNLNGNIQLTFDATKQTFISASLAQNNATTTTLTWNYVNLLPFERRYIDVSFTTLIPPVVNAGDSLNLTLTGNPTIGDANIANNQANLIQTVYSSFDPNDKTVIEGSTVGISNLDNYLTYVTRFQNTGTANATTVVIKDVFDSNLDYTTFEPIGSSHNATIQIKNGSAVTYTFSNINLAYSSDNEAASHGWMAYRIKPKNNLVVGNIMSSQSNIYFDYNFPILTNRVDTQVVALGIASFDKKRVTIYPNPSSGIVTIRAEEAINNVTVYNLNGQKLQLPYYDYQLDVTPLSKGIYLIEITDETNTKTEIKFVKE